MNGDFFEYHIDLPDAELTHVAETLVGFKARYERLRRNADLLSVTDELSNWGREHYGEIPRICDVVSERSPLFIFSGDVGTGKTATAKSFCSLMSADLKREGHLYALGTRVRGSGKVGQGSTQIDEAFETVAAELGKKKLCFLFIDEADSLLTTREEERSHLEDKVNVNTIIQKVDGIKRHQGRFLVILSTNRLNTLDPSVIRRSALVESFSRPTEDERRELFEMDCAGLGLASSTIDQLVTATGPRSTKPGFTFSDIRMRLLPQALSRAFPQRKMIDDDFLEAVNALEASPSIGENG